MIHEAFTKQLLHTGLKDTKKDQTQSLPSKNLKNCAGEEFSYVISEVKELKLGSFGASVLGLYGQDKLIT